MWLVILNNRSETWSSPTWLHGATFKMTLTGSGRFLRIFPPPKAPSIITQKATMRILTLFIDCPSYHNILRERCIPLWDHCFGLCRTPSTGCYHYGWRINSAHALLLPAAKLWIIKDILHKMALFTAVHRSRWHCLSLSQNYLQFEVVS
jgi:hypothetical protein